MKITPLLSITATAVSVLALTACGGVDNDSPAVDNSNATGAGWTIDDSFNERFKDGFIRIQEEQNGYGDVSIESQNCIKSGDLTADCIVVASGAGLLPTRFGVDVTCSLDMEDCSMEAEPINLVEP